MEQFKPKAETSEPKGLEEFKRILEEQNWMTNADGEDFCLDHFKKYLDQFGDDKETRRGARQDSRRTSENAETRISRDGWHVICEDFAECNKDVFVPFEEE